MGSVKSACGAPSPFPWAELFPHLSRTFTRFGKTRAFFRNHCLETWKSLVRGLYGDDVVWETEQWHGVFLTHHKCSKTTLM